MSAIPAPVEAIVFVNDRPVHVARGGSVLDALVAADADVADRAREARVAVTDARGLPVQLTDPLHDGMILRAIGSARQASGD